MLNLFYYISMGYLKFSKMKIKFMKNSVQDTTKKSTVFTFRVIRIAIDNAGECGA